MSAPRDENRIATMQAISNVDGTTITSVLINASNHALAVDDGTTGTSQAVITNDPRDENREVAFWAVSSVDGVTPVAVYCDPSNGKLLINSN